MSTSTSVQTSEIQERTSKATKKLYQALGYESLKSTDLKYIALALVEVAAEEVSKNPRFANNVKAILDEIYPKKEKKVSRASSVRSREKKHEPTTIPTQKGSLKKSPLDNLVPLKPIDMRIINPYSSPDPFLLYDVFGREQLSIALEEFTLSTLRKMTTVVEEQNPDVPKPNKGKKELMVHFILDIVEATRAKSIAQ